MLKLAILSPRTLFQGGAKKFMHRVELCLWGYWLRRLFYQEQVDKEGRPLPLRKLFGNLNQRLMESGHTVPWVMTREECQDFWASITNDERFSCIRPVSYAAKDIGIIEFLHSFWTPQVAPENSILELGCNCGANLNALYNLGYHNLSGIEINENAITEMKRSFPQLAKVAIIAQGSLEELLPKTPSKSVDVVLTMSVLFHIHPKSNFVFSEMVRVARKYILTLEPEMACCAYVFPRNYRRIFEKLGCPQLKSVMITKEASPGVKRSYDGTTIRLFAVP